jgi:hypothetical protein
LNGDKTEILVLSVAHRPCPSIDTFNISGFDIFPSSSARNIGVIFDNIKLSLEAHITSICKSCFLHLYNIWKIRRCLSLGAWETLVRALVSFKLDFCNSLLYGLSKSSLKKLQHVQNAAAKLVSLSRKHDHITPIVLNLQITLITLKILNNIVPSYLSDLIKSYVLSRSLSSSSSSCA